MMCIFYRSLNILSKLALALTSIPIFYLPNYLDCLAINEILINSLTRVYHLVFFTCFDKLTITLQYR